MIGMDLTDFLYHVQEKLDKAIENGWTEQETQLRALLENPNSFTSWPLSPKEIERQQQRSQNGG